MKSTKKIVSLILATVLLLGIFVITPISASAANGVQSKLDAVRAVYPNSCYYFTKSGNACDDAGGSDCKLQNIPARGGLPSGAAVSSWGCWSCFAFAEYVFGYTFGYSFRNCATGAAPVLGDVIKVVGWNGYDHYGIYLGQDANNYYVFDGNGDGKCGVIYNHAINKSQHPLKQTYHAPNYNTVNGTNIPYSKPEIVKAYINYQTASSYRVNIVVTNVECIESVRVATWTNQSQSDLHWNYCNFNGYATYFIDISRSEYEKNAKSYCNDIYLKDIKGQDVGYKRIGTIYNNPEIVKTYINYQKTDSYRVNIEVTNCESVESVRVATWTTQDQSDLHWNYCYFNGYATYFIDLNRADFNKDKKTYINDVYLYDGSGNCVGYERIFTYYKDATLLDVRVTKTSSKGYRVVAKVDSQFGVASAQYPTWTENNGQDDLVWHSASVSGNYISCYIKASEHKNELNRYITHLYFTDSIGQTFNFTGILPYIYLNDEVSEIDSVTHSNHKYALYNHEFTWTEAKEWCESQGGHLVTITDVDEWEAVKGLLANNGGIPVWLGGERISGTDNFKWVDNTPFEFADWEKDQPDNSNSNEDYLGTHNGDYYLDCYSWNDYTNNHTRIGGFICEFDEVETPTEPTPSESQPTKPTSSENQPTEPSSSESQPTEPSSSESNPTEPSSSESQPTETQPSKTDISKWNVSGIKNKTYTGRVIKQDNIIVSKDGEYADFSVKYKNNLNVGTATVTITGTGDYTGTIVKTFKITKAANPITVKVTTKTVKLAAVKKKAQTVKAITVSKAQGKVSYKLTSVPKALKKYVKINSKGVITISKWAKAKKGTYKIKVKISAAGNKNYNSKSLTKTVTIKIK